MGDEERQWRRTEALMKRDLWKAGWKRYLSGQSWVHPSDVFGNGICRHSCRLWTLSDAHQEFLREAVKLAEIP